jgi:16S rRNA G966 N2-methylase RsmD
MRAAAEDRRELTALFKAADEEKPLSNRKIAIALNVRESTIRNDLNAQNCAPADKILNENNEGKPSSAQNCAPSLPSGERAGSLIAAREGRKARDAAANVDRIGSIPKGPGSIDMRIGDFRAVLADLKDVDAIITDPPYGREYLPLMRDLAAFADRVLKPEGVLAVLYGQTWLPEAMALMTGFRPWRWMGCYLTAGPGYVSHARGVSSNWKPILTYGGGPRFGDVLQSLGDGEAKERHPWGQDYRAFKDIVAALTSPGAKVVDPFAGGGTTLMAANALGRHAIGCDIDPAFKIEGAA